MYFIVQMTRQNRYEQDGCYIVHRYFKCRGKHFYTLTTNVRNDGTKYPIGVLVNMEMWDKKDRTWTDMAYQEYIDPADQSRDEAYEEWLAEVMPVVFDMLDGD